MPHPRSILLSYLLQSTKAEPSFESGASFGETKTITSEDGRLTETQDKDVVLEDPDTVSVYNQWTAPRTSGQPPKARYQVIFNLTLLWNMKGNDLFVYLLSFLILVYYIRFSMEQRLFKIRCICMVETTTAVI